MAETVGDFLVGRLREWGVKRIFGHSGDGINGIVGALGRAGNRPELIQPPHEELAALMACGHAKFTGEVGVCLSTQGPGAIHMLNGLYDAKLDHQPVVAIVGQQSEMALGSHYQQEVDLPVLLKDVASEYVQTISHPAAARHMIDRAFRIAIAQRTVTCLIVPHDVQNQPAVASPPPQHGANHSSPGYSPPRVVPHDDDLRRAADVLNAGQKVAILVGQGALSAGGDVAAVAERLGAGVAKALLGKAVLPDDLPFVTGSIGWLGTRASHEMMQRCDTLLMVGTSFPYTEFLPKEGQARAIQVDLDGRMLGFRHPVEAGLVGDAALTLRALLPLLAPKTDRAWRGRIEASVRAWWAETEARAMRDADPLNPQRVVRELSERLPDRALVCGDCGSGTVWYARDVKFRAGMFGSLSGTLATMGGGIPYAVAAKLAHPDRPVAAIVGDGAMQMNGLNALLSVARFRSRWTDPRFVILVLNNRDLNFVTWEQRAMEGDPRFAPTQDVPDFPYARYAELLGLRGLRVDRPEQVGAAWDEAFRADRPVVLDAVVDPNVPTLPPELQAEQREKLRRSLGRGDAEALGVLRQLRQAGYDLTPEPSADAE